MNKGTKNIKWEIISELSTASKTSRSAGVSAGNSSSSKAQVYTEVQSDWGENLLSTPTTSAATVIDEVLSPAPMAPVTVMENAPTETEGCREPTTGYFDRLAIEGEKEPELERETKGQPVEWRTIDQTSVEDRSSNAGTCRGSDTTDTSQLKTPLLSQSEVNTGEDGSFKTKTERDSESKNSTAAGDSKCCDCSVQ